MPRFHKRRADFLITDFDYFGNAGHKVVAPDLHRLYLVARVGRTDGDLDEFSGAFTDKQIVLGFDVLNDCLVHFVTAHACRTGKYYSGKRNYGDLGGPAPDIDN